MITLAFFQNESGSEPVREWLKELPDADRRCIGQDLMRVQWRWPVGMPLCRALGSGLWEVRSELPGGRIARVIVCFHDREIVALHEFVKKSRKTPKAELVIAVSRKRELSS